jgi:DNA-binding response OmpR family regulator
LWYTFVMSAKSSTILLVEDDPNDVLLVKRAFRKANVANPLQVVSDGEAAVAYLAGQGNFTDRARFPLPAVVLLDLKLPRKSGLEVLVWLREQADLKRLPVVVLTSSSEAGDVNRAYELGANSYLVKPVAFENLLNLVKALHQYWLTLNVYPKVYSD